MKLCIRNTTRKKMKIPRNLAKLIRENKSFLIVSHVNPEGDAVGSCIGLALGLKKQGKKVHILSKSPLPETYEFLPGSGLVRTRPASGPAHDVLCLVDCHTIERTGLTNLNAKNTVILDHHLLSTQLSPRSFPGAQLITYIDANASASGEIIYRLLHALSIPLDGAIATNLYTAIYSDTGGFRYSNTGPETLRIAAELIEAGTDPWEVTKAVYENLPLGTLRLLSMSLATLEKKGPVAWITINGHMFKKTRTTVQDTENIVDFPRKIRGVEVAVLFREEKEHYFKVSLRSKGKVNVAEIARFFGGGGHANAAGCRIRGPLHEVKRVLFRAIRTSLKG